MNPFMAFCLYVAARVFVQYLKKMPNDQEIRQSLEFLLTAMQALQRKNPLTESFLVQLKMDIEGSGLGVSFHSSASQYSEETVSALYQCKTTRQITSSLHEFQLIRSRPQPVCLPITVSVNISAPISFTSQRHLRKANLLPIISHKATHEFRITMQGKKVQQSVRKTLASRHIPTASPPIILPEKRTVLSFTLQLVSIPLLIETRSAPSILQTTDV